MKRVFFTVSTIFMTIGFVYAQQGINDTLLVRGVVIGGDTLPSRYLPPVYIVDSRIFKNKREEVKYTKLRRDVLKVLPYARMAGEKYHELERQLSFVKEERLQKALTKRTEQEIRDRFEEELKELTITQGRILVKLIDRETGHTTYTVLQEFRGNISAFLWQGVARIFGSNLKWEYDPQVERDIEAIILSADAQDFLYKAQK